jgi:serine/threonine-protein kinase
MTPEQNETPTDAWHEDDVLSDRYRIVQEQRRSSTGSLYQAVDVFREVPHLLLCPSSRTMKDPSGLQWFIQFCRNALAIPRHPNLLACRRMDYHGRMPYLVMDYVEGRYWDEKIKDGELTELSTMLDVAIQVARGLEWLHENGRIHGNIKPANVLLSSETGIAEVLKYGEVDAHTRAYAAPEQLTADRPITAATDAWCWGASVLHMFSGMVNWSLGSQAPRALQRYLRNGPAVPGLALMPVPVVHLLEQCFQDDPARRPTSTARITEQLENVYYDVTNAAYESPEPDETYDSEHLVDEEIAEAKRRAHRRQSESAPPRRRFSTRRKPRSDSRSRRRPDHNS